MRIVAQDGWSNFFNTGKVDDYLKYRKAENMAAEALDDTGPVKPALPEDAVDGMGTGEAKPALPIDVEQDYADQNGRRGS